MDRRRLMLGDWHPLVRDGIDVLRYGLGVGAIAFALASDWGDAAYLAMLFAVAMLGRLVLLPRVYDLALVLGLSLQGWGEVLGMYDSWAGFDTVVHVTLPFFVAPVVYIGLARLQVVPDPKDDTDTRRHWGIFVVTLTVGMAIGALWELVEWALDAWAGADLQEGLTDTNRDLLADTIGAVLGALLLVQWSRHSWGSVRRIPGENRFEEVDV